MRETEYLWAGVSRPSFYRWPLACTTVVELTGTGTIAAATPPAGALRATIRRMNREITALQPVPAETRVRYGDRPSQFLDVWGPRSQSIRGAAVMIHGGFWRVKYGLGHASHFCAALAAAGLSVANLEYRRVGENGGGWPCSLDDVLRGVKTAHEYLGAAPVVLGHSAGGHLALRIASETSEIKAVVALAPVADLQRAYALNLSNGAVVEFLGQDSKHLPELLESACAMNHTSEIPRVLVHGAADDVVPIELSRNYVEARKGDPGSVTLLEIPGANHFDLIDPQSAAWPTIRDIVLQLAGI